MSDITYLKKIKINSFRGIKDVELNLGSRINIICGKNGTSKSTILGAIAQLFSFTKDHFSNTDLSYKTLTGKPFISSFSEHFRISEEYDAPGSMDITLDVYDAYSKKHINGLALDLVDIADRKARVVIRNNIPSPYSTNTSRKITHPVIYLSLKRLMPISERILYDPVANAYLDDNKSDFIALSNKILCKPSGVQVTSTKGTMHSTVVHGTNYDHESVSAGEDNIGQILLSLFSFKQLKEAYPDYHGGILLIDEADAGLFPAAQKEFLQVLSNQAKKLNIQIVMTSHSPILIEEVKKLSEFSPKEYKTFYLTDSFGGISLIENMSWDQILADLFTETIQVSGQNMLPPINTYFEDQEAVDFFNSIVIEKKYKKILKKLDNITLSCDHYITLLKNRVSEFTHKSLIILDGDVTKANAYKGVVRLPTNLPPDQLLFDILFRLDPSDEFWKNDIFFTKAVFWRISSNLCSRLGLSSVGALSDYDLNKLVKLEHSRNANPPIREDFKKFYKTPEIQSLLKRVHTNPFRLFLDKNPDIKSEFMTRLNSSLKFIFEEGYHVPTSKVTALLDE